MSRPPTDRNPLKVASSWWLPRYPHLSWRFTLIAKTAELLDRERRARDAAWRRAVREAFAAELKVLRLNRNAQELLPHMLKLVLAAAPGARGTKAR